jgi:hypothetical protein
VLHSKEQSDSQYRKRLENELGKCLEDDRSIKGKCCAEMTTPVRSNALPVAALPRVRSDCNP